jgi:hypothetical protein
MAGIVWQDEFKEYILTSDHKYARYFRGAGQTSSQAESLT